MALPDVTTDDHVTYKVNIDSSIADLDSRPNLVILDTPEEIVSPTLVNTVWTTVNSVTLSSVNAKKAIISCILSIEKPAVTSLVGEMYLRKTGSTLLAGVLTNKVANYSRSPSSTTLTVRAVNECTVNLDGNGDFDYSYQTTLGLSVDASRLILVGYYV